MSSSDEKVVEILLGYILALCRILKVEPAELVKLSAQERANPEMLTKLNHAMLMELGMSSEKATKLQELMVETVKKEREKDGPKRPTN